MAAALTRFESRLLEAVATHIGRAGHAPTIAELAEQLGVQSRGSVHRYLQSLISKGFLHKDGRGWRNIRLVKSAGVSATGASAGATAAVLPASVSAQLQQPGFPETRRAENIRTGNKITRQVNQLIELNEHELKEKFPKIPLLGKIAAGMPIEAISDEEHLDLAGFFIGPDRFALRVTGDSMIEAGILDGDTVIVRKQSTALSGDIVVALIDLQEATLKRLGRYSDESIELIPENCEMATLIYSGARVSIQGVVVGQMRTY